MNKEEYRSQLTILLHSLPKKEREEAVAFYMEMIADRMDEGMSEEEAVAHVSSPGEAAQEIIAQSDEKRLPLVSLSIDVGNDDPEDEGDEDDGERTEERFIDRLKARKLSVFECVMLVVLSPLWLPLLILAMTLAILLIVAFFVLYACAWTLVACVWLIGISSRDYSSMTRFTLAVLRLLIPRSCSFRLLYGCGDSSLSSTALRHLSCCAHG